MHTGVAMCGASSKHSVKNSALSLQFGSHDGKIHPQCHHLAEYVLESAKSDIRFCTVLNQNINYITGHRYPWCVYRSGFFENINLKISKQKFASVTP
jgi:hypothetical protein